MSGSNSNTSHGPGLVGVTKRKVIRPTFIAEPGTKSTSIKIKPLVLKNPLPNVNKVLVPNVSSQVTQPTTTTNAQGLTIPKLQFPKRGSPSLEVTTTGTALSVKLTKVCPPMAQPKLAPLKLSKPFPKALEIRPPEPLERKSIQLSTTTSNTSVGIPPTTLMEITPEPNVVPSLVPMDISNSEAKPKTIMHRYKMQAETSEVFYTANSRGLVLFSKAVVMPISNEPIPTVGPVDVTFENRLPLDRVKELITKCQSGSYTWATLMADSLQYIDESDESEEKSKDLWEDCDEKEEDMRHESPRSYQSPEIGEAVDDQ